MKRSVNPPTETEPGPIIRLRDVAVAFNGHAVLRSLTSEYDRGEFVSIVGPSGCGKSTLLRVIAGLQETDAGQLTIGNSTDATPDEAVSFHWRTGFVFQQPTLLAWRNALDNIGLPLELRGVGAQKRIAAAREVRTLVGLSADDENKLPKMLSGGMQMRVSLARTLVTHPKVMLMDEPLAAVDDILRNQLLVELADLWQRQRWTTILVTHNVAEAVFISQRVLVMSPRPGRIVDSIEVPFDYPRTPDLRATGLFAELIGRVSNSLRAATA